MKAKRVNRSSGTRAGRQITKGLKAVRGVLSKGRLSSSTMSVRTVEVRDPAEHDARSVRAIRDAVGVSQRVFARMLGVSTVLVQSWEQGKRKPARLACRLLEEIARDPARWSRLVSGAPAASTPPRRRVRVA